MITAPRRRLRAILATGAGLGAIALATAAVASPSDDARDARLAKLEAAVAALQAQAQQGQAAVAQNQELAKQNAELKEEVGQLESQVSDLKASAIQQIDDVRQDVKQTEANAPKVTFPGGRPTFSTADGQFTASLRGQLQLDTAAYLQPAAGNVATDFRRDGPAIGASATNVDQAHARDLKDGTDWRRARIGIDGTAYGDWDYRILFDFGGSGVEDAGQLYEAWAQYSGLKPFHFRIGAWPTWIGLEDQTSTNNQMFLERPGISDITRNLAAGDTRIGAGGYASDNLWFLSFAVTGRTIGVVNTGTFITSTTVGASSADVGTGQTFGDQVGLVGRAVFTPLHGDDWRLNLGVHGSYVDRPGDTTGPGTNGQILDTGFGVKLSDTPELRVDGTQFINTGTIPAHNASTLGVEVAAQKGPFFLEGEAETIHVTRSDGIANPTFGGWYVEGSYFLTGETRLYNASTGAFDGPIVAHPFSPKHNSWGAWEFAFRVDNADLNFDQGFQGTAPSAAAIRGGDQKIVAFGLNWYPNQVFHFQLDVDHVQIDRLSPSATLFATPTGAQIGQTYNVIALRTQVGF